MLKVYNELAKQSPENIWRFKETSEKMFNKTRFMFTYKNLPHEIPVDILEKILQECGQAIIFKYEDKFYVDEVHPTGDYDFYGRKYKYTVTNSKILGGTLIVEEGVDAILIKNDSYMQGLKPLIYKYALHTMVSDVTLEMQMELARAPFIFKVDDEDVKREAEAFLKDIRAGKMGVMLTDNMGVEAADTMQFNLPSSSGITDLLELDRYRKSEIYAELGIQTNDNGKRAYVNNAELDQQANATTHLIGNMESERRIAINKANAFLFDEEVEVTINPDWDIAKNKPAEVAENIAVEEAPAEEAPAETEEVGVAENATTEEPEEELIEVDSEEITEEDIETINELKEDIELGGEDDEAGMETESADDEGRE